MNGYAGSCCPAGSQRYVVAPVAVMVKAEPEQIVVSLAVSNFSESVTTGTEVSASQMVAFITSFS